MKKGIKNKYVWAKQDGYLTMPHLPSFLYLTNTKLAFGDKLYANKSGYSQKRKTENYLGMVLSTKKHTTPNELLRLERKLLKKLAKELYNL